MSMLSPYLPDDFGLAHAAAIGLIVVLWGFYTPILRQIGEARELALERQHHRTRRPVTLFADDDFLNAFVTQHPSVRVALLLNDDGEQTLKQRLITNEMTLHVIARTKNK